MAECGPEADDRRAKALTREFVRALAEQAGFSEAGMVGLPHERDARDAERFGEWVSEGRAGGMAYLTRTDEEGRLLRARVAVPFPWARSVIVCLANYNSAQPRSIEPAGDEAGWIARYAWSSRVDGQGQRRPSDYHKVLLKRMRALEERLRADFGDFQARAFVDTGPVVERSLATAAGVGWSAKNTCLIHPKLGSYVFLAVLVTSLEAEDAGGWRVPDRCGSCTRCLEACPTDALIAPYQMDARKCISYLTIEHRGAIEPGLMEGMGRQVFGCDICQDVCPWNRKAAVAQDAELEAREELVNPALEMLAGLDEKAFEAMFNGSPVRRARYDGLRRNVAVAMGNSGRAEYEETLRAWTEEEEEGLRTAARWALEKLGGCA